MKPVRGAPSLARRRDARHALPLVSDPMVPNIAPPLQGDPKRGGWAPWTTALLVALTGSAVAAERPASPRSVERPLPPADAAGFGGQDVPAAPVAERFRGIVIKPTAVVGAPTPQAQGSTPKPPHAEVFRRFADEAMAEPIRIAPATGSPDQLAALLPPAAPVEAVTREAAPDLIWDPSFKDVVTPSGDLVAEDIDRNGIIHIIDRTLALRQLQFLIVDAPQNIVLLPDDAVKPRGSIVRIEVADAAGRSLILFNIRCDGKVQLLYPRRNDPPIITDPRFTLSLRISDPLGSDAIIAVTGTQRLVDLEQGLSALSGQKAPVAAVKLIHDTALPGTLVGSVAVFSAEPVGSR